MTRHLWPFVYFDGLLGWAVAAKRRRLERIEYILQVHRNAFWL
jgi:hypothetical protein